MRSSQPQVLRQKSVNKKKPCTSKPQKYICEAEAEEDFDLEKDFNEIRTLQEEDER